MKKNVVLALLVLAGTIPQHTYSRDDAYKMEMLSATKKWDLVSQMFLTDKTIEQEKANAIKHEYLERDFYKRRPVTTLFGWVSLASIENNANLYPDKHHAIICSLASDPKLIQHLEQLLLSVKKSESSILSFWQDEDPEIKMHIDALYTRKGKRSFHRNYSPAWQQFFTYARTEKPDLEESGELAASVFASTFLKALTGLDFYFPTEKTRLYFYQLHKTLQVLHQRTKGIAKVTGALDAVIQVLNKHPEFTYLPHGQEFVTLKKTLHQKDAHSLNQLFTLLRTNTFKGTLSCFSYRGRVRVAYLLTNDFKNDLIPLLMALGELDVYLAYAKMC